MFNFSNRLHIHPQLSRDIRNMGLYLLVSLILIVSSLYFYTSASESYSFSMNHLTSNQNTLRNAQRKLKLYHQYSEPFNTLYHSGILDSDPRQNFREHLEILSNRFKLPYLKYDISPLKPDNSSPTNISVNKASVLLTMGLLHEGDLFSLFNYLKTYSHALFHIEYCNISRNARSSVSDIESLSPQSLLSECKLWLFNIHTPDPDINRSLSSK